MAQWGTPRRTVILDQEPSGDLSPVQSAASDQQTAQQTPGKAAAGNQSALLASGKASLSGDGGDLHMEDKPCTVMMSATGLLARSTSGALDAWRSRPRNQDRGHDDQIIAIFATTTLATYGLVTTAGRLITAPVADLPMIPATANPNLSGGIVADELLGGTTSTDTQTDEHAITVIDMADSRPLALGTRLGTVKRWNRESPTTMDSWSIIDLKREDQVVFAAPCQEQDRMVFISSDASLLTFTGNKVRPQGRNAAGMAGIRLSQGCQVVTFAVVPAGEISWTYEETGEDGMSIQAGAVVLTVAGDSEALPGTENGAAKLTPLEMYPVKGRGTGGVRSQRFLKGQDTLLLARVGAWPLHASTAAGSPIELPDVDMRRDASGQELAAPIAFVA